jgi:hypothetical protein
MNIHDALELVKNDDAIVVRDKTFHPRGLDQVTLETGETVYWVHSREGLWLSLDPQGEEIILFEDIDEALEPEDEIIVYGGEDYEFSYEGTASTSLDDGGKVTTFKDYEASSGEIVRLMEEESTGEVTGAYGVKLTEEDLQAA